MKKKSTFIIWLGILAGIVIMLTNSSSAGVEIKPADILTDRASGMLKNKALRILEDKCNVCHRRQNPLMLFKDKNMEKRAIKIYNMVFVERRMPKGDEIRLTFAEYQILEEWLFTQNIF